MPVISTKEKQDKLDSLLSTVKKRTLYGAGAFLLFVTAMGSFSTVGPGQRGIRVTMGKTGTEVLGEGPHLKLPFVSYIKTMSIRIHKTEDDADAATKDIQKIHSKVALNWTINPDSVGKMLREVGDEDSIENNIIAPAVSEIVKAATARMTAEEVLLKRIELKSTIDEALIKRLTSYGLVIKDISLVNLDFDAEFNRAVEAKQIAEQQAKQAEYVTQKALQEAKATVETAKGEAKASLEKARAQAEGQALLKQNLTKDVLKLEYLKKWDGRLPNVLTGSGNGVMLNVTGNDNERESTTQNKTRSVQTNENKGESNE